MDYQCIVLTTLPPRHTSIPHHIITSMPPPYLFILTPQTPLMPDAALLCRCSLWPNSPAWVAEWSVVWSSGSIFCLVSVYWMLPTYWALGTAQYRIIWSGAMGCGVVQGESRRKEEKQHEDVGVRMNATAKGKALLLSETEPGKFNF